MKIAILGPRGTFSEKAAKQWDSKAEIVYCDSISDAIEAILTGEVDFSIVPIENSLDGSIRITLDLLRENAPPVIGEMDVHVELCLLFKGKKEDVTMIYSKSEALTQCPKYIKTNFPGVQVYESTSTADAAHKASLAKHIAAVASREAAREYGLKIFAENIQDVNENYTRFIVIGKEKSVPTGNDKTSLIVCPEANRPGALYEILGEFANRGIDLTKIESRPTKRKLGEYLFYLDARGHELDPKSKIREAIQAVKNKARVIVLGSYPIGPVLE